MSSTLLLETNYLLIRLNIIMIYNIINKCTSRSTNVNITRCIIQYLINRGR